MLSHISERDVPCLLVGYITIQRKSGRTTRPKMRALNRCWKWFATGRGCPPIFEGYCRDFLPSEHERHAIR